MEKTTNLEFMKKKLVDYAIKNKFDKIDIDTIKECNIERRLKYCLDILEKTGKLTSNQLNYIILTD